MYKVPVKSLSQNISQAKEYGGSPCGPPENSSHQSWRSSGTTQRTNLCPTSLCVTSPVAALVASPRSSLCRAAHSNEFLQLPRIFLPPSNYTERKVDVVWYSSKRFTGDLPDFLLGINCRAPQFWSFHCSNFLSGLTYWPFQTFPTPYGCCLAVGLMLLPTSNLTFCLLIPPELTSTVLSW